MSRKHNQRTRAEILAKREQPIPAKMLNRFGVGGAVVPSTPNADVRRASRSKYTPHIGAKEQERAKRCYMAPAFVSGLPRSGSIMNQMSKPQYAEPAYYPANAEQWNEYDSVF